MVAALATDGVPTDCTPTSIAGVAKIAATGLASTPQIDTFTIRLFSSADAAEGQATLNLIALGGGTKSAFVLTTATDVTVQFRAALEAIRSTQLSCEFRIPQPDSEQTIDYSPVNLNDKSASKQTSTLLYVADIEHCDALKGGLVLRCRPRWEALRGSQCARSRATPSRAPSARPYKSPSAVKPS